MQRLCLCLTKKHFPIKKLYSWVTILGIYSLRRCRSIGIGIPIINLRRSGLMTVSGYDGDSYIRKGRQFSE